MPRDTYIFYSSFIAVERGREREDSFWNFEYLLIVKAIDEQSSKGRGLFLRCEVGWGHSCSSA